MKLNIDSPKVRSAVHEAGHAITAFACNRVSKISSIIIDEGNGHVLYEFYTNYSINDYYAMTIISLAGLAAELIVFKKSNPSHSRKDLSEVLDYVKNIIKINKLNELKLHKYKKDITKVYLGSFSDLERKIINSAYIDAKIIINNFGNKYYELVSTLIYKEKMNESDMESIFGPRFPIKITGQNSKSVVHFYFPREFTIIEKVKQWLHKNLFQMLQKFSMKLTNMLNS